MQGSGRFIIKIGAGVLLLVLYVHLNVSLFTVSYALDKKNKELAQRSEQYRHLKFQVEQLRAPHRLAMTMEKYAMGLDLPKEVRVVQVNVPAQVPMHRLEKTVPHPLGEGFLNFVGRWVQTAQAKTDS